MKRFLAPLCLLGSLLQATEPCAGPTSEFQLKGDYLLGGLFDIHHFSTPYHQERPEAMHCSSKPFLLPHYRWFELMRFSVEEINNSTSLLPNVSLGYEIFDHCSDAQNFPDVFKLISANGLIQPWSDPQRNQSELIGVVGPFTSSQVQTVAPLFMEGLIPVVSYGGTASIFSKKSQYPSFLRTVHPNKETLNVIVDIILHFNWRWVAFLNSDSDFGIDGLELFRKMILDTEICLAYTKSLDENVNYSQMFKQIEAQKVDTIIVFASRMQAEAVIESAIQLNVTNKVWMADEGWSLNTRLPKMQGIRNIGTVIGVSQPVVTIPGFSDFIYSTKNQPPCEDLEQQRFCNQICNCSDLSAEDILDSDPSFSFHVYSAVYAIAHALHNTLKCGGGSCNNNITVHPHMVLEKLRSSSFTLLDQIIQFDENGDPKFGSYSIVFWNSSGEAEEIGHYKFHPSVNFYINDSKIQWHANGEVPTALCSPECPPGHAKKQTGIHKCCFSCEICPRETYVNSTEDPYRCIPCQDTEWAAEGSTSCSLRLVEYVPFSDTSAVVILAGACVLVGLILAVSVLFTVHYNTPVVKSAGGPMCFLIVICLFLSNISVFFYFDVPTTVYCVFRFVPFLLFFTVCLACFAVRSFQIVCIFKMAAKFPVLHSLWMKYHGQQLLIALAFISQALIILIVYCIQPPSPNENTLTYQDKIILGCDFNLVSKASVVVLPVLLCSVCFIFSYMGKDLPKNYNEAKAITFCLLMLVLTWIIFITEYILYQGKHTSTFNALAVLSSLYCFLLWYFLPKCYIIIFQPDKNTQQYFQGLIQSYTKTISQ